MKIMKCDARAFARCPYKKQCSDSPEHTSFYEGTECDYFNQQVIHAPLTNADRIRAMSDEELAWELMTWRLDAVARNHGIEGVYPDTQKEILKWLQSPTEEDA